MRSAMIGIAVGTVGAVASTFVLVSLHALIDEPDRWGVTWDGVGALGDPTLLDTAVDLLADDDDLTAIGVLDLGLVQSDGTDIATYAFTSAEGSIEPTVRRGRLPADDDEIALGELSMGELDVDIGDTIAVDGVNNEDPVPLEVVGAVALPPYNDSRPAMGAVMTPDGLAPVNQANQDRSILVRYRPGVDPDEVVDRLATDYAIGFLPAITPPQLANIDESSVVIRALVVFFIALAVVGLAQALVLSIRRQRSSVAVWRALGFVRGQVRRSILWQSALVVGVAVAVGVPLGLYVGQVAWRLTVQNIGVVDDPTLPIVPAGIALPVALAASVLIAALPAWLAARSDPVEDLHAE
jgi:hypothetical protein